MQEPEKQIEFRKIREFSDIVSDSFEFIKNEFKPVFRLIVPYVLPFVIIYAVLHVYVQMKVLTQIDFSDPERFISQLGPVYVNIFFSSLFGVFMQSLLVGTYYTYLIFYIDRGKGNFSTSDIAPVLFSNTLYALGANLLIFMLVVIGVMFCILPGIYIGNSLSLVVMVLLFERKGLGHAFSRSWKLVHTRWWHTFGLNLLSVVILYAISFIFSLPGIFAGINASIMNNVSSAEAAYPNWYWVVLGLSSAVSSLAWIIGYTFLAMQYFNLDELQEQFSAGDDQ